MFNINRETCRAFRQYRHLGLNSMYTDHKCSGESVETHSRVLYYTVRRCVETQRYKYFNVIFFKREYNEINCVMRKHTLIPFDTKGNQYQIK